MIVTSVNCAWDSCTDMELHQSMKPVQGGMLLSLHPGPQITAYNLFLDAMQLRFSPVGRLFSCSVGKKRKQTTYT